QTLMGLTGHSSAFYRRWRKTLSISDMRGVVKYWAKREHQLPDAINSDSIKRTEYSWFLPLICHQMRALLIECLCDRVRGHRKPSKDAMQGGTLKRQGALQILLGHCCPPIYQDGGRQG